jgi:hypothetical protein
MNAPLGLRCVLCGEFCHWKSIVMSRNEILLSLDATSPVRFHETAAHSGYKRRGIWHDHESECHVFVFLEMAGLLVPSTSETFVHLLAM